MKTSRFFYGLSIVLLFVSVTSSAAEIGIPAITQPSNDAVLTFTRPGRISTLYVKEGDQVEAEQELIKQDDVVEQIKLAQLKAQAEETSQMEASKASLGQKEVDLKKIRWAAERGSATKLELEHAILDVTIAELSYQIAQFEHRQNQKKYEEAKAGLDRMIIKSPIKGRVEQIDFEIGESVDASKPVVRVVKLDPLLIDVPAPSMKGRLLKTGQSVQVNFPGQKKIVKNGKIVFVSNVIDAGSDTLRVRVEVPNEMGRPAGEQVQVILSK